MTYEIYTNWSKLSSRQNRQNSSFITGKRRLHITSSHRIYEFVHAFSEWPNKKIASPLPFTPFPIHRSLITCSLWTNEHVTKNHISYSNYLATGRTKILNIILGEKWMINGLSEGKHYTSAISWGCWEHGRKCTHKEMLRHYILCVCVYACLSFPACKAHVLYYTVICGLSTSILFHKQHDFRKKNFEHKTCVLIFPATSVRNISHFQKNWARCNHKHILLVFM
jgi:hypothetical protein